ncbi:uncharacterized protein LOC111242617 [Vigna radiata var. radiata]|uniref:Uncharacterized protein LOC111242617 n=1 Tax=Vigna radiata var. radiata TaxID=3916 RepID=A0A3Q0FFK5_VIGRR|nr:uncharacterized protein LOC111242617 [Vigna radiata var. radiata]
MDEERIKIVVHHSGKFLTDDNGVFKFDGEIAEWSVDADLLSYFGIVASVKELGHMDIKELWYGFGGQSVHPHRLELLTDDKGAMHMLNIGRLNEEVHLYVVHNMVEPQIIEFIDWVGGEEGYSVDVEVHTEGDGKEGGEVQVEGVEGGEVQVEGVEVQVKGGEVEDEVKVEDADVDEVQDGEVQGEVQVEDANVDEVQDGEELHEVQVEVQGNLHHVYFRTLIVFISLFYDRYWSQCDTLVNNMSEAFNNVLVDSRSKPIISMLEDIRVYIMKRWAANKTKMTQYHASICPKVWNRFQKESSLGRYWLPRWSREKLFEVMHISEFGNQFVVNVDTMDYTCRKWAINGIPCAHAITSMKFVTINAEDYITHWFRKSTYEETYNSIIYPINGQHIWEVTPYSDILPPKKKRMPGRPKKKQRLEDWELKKNDSELRKGGQRKKCGICKELGHNKNTRHPRSTNRCSTYPRIHCDGNCKWSSSTTRPHCE